MKKETELKIVGWRLKEAIKLRGLKQRDLANKVGVSEAFISRAIHGTISRSFALERIAEALDVSVAWLVGNDDEMKRDVVSQSNLASLEDAPDITEVLSKLYATFPVEIANGIVAGISKHARTQIATH